MRLVSLLVIGLAYSVVAAGQTVYRSVDEQGVVTFSDTPPADGENAERMQINAPPPSSTGEYEANLEAMRETTDRMAADRREREKHRAEMRELQARTTAYQAPTQIERDYAYDDYGYYTGYRSNRGHGRFKPGKPGRPPWRPGHKPRPEQPIARPPYRPDYEPGLSRPTDNNAQLMRPITSRGGGRR